uniref:Annexin n=2 Tax=Globodera pallida TaxID=36090 RepID=A0A183BP75_GLOPA
MSMRGFTTSEVAQAICAIDNQQRQQLASEFKKEFGTDLVVALEKAFKGHFEEMIIALMQTPAVYDANQMHEAMSGMRTNDPLLIEILSTRSNRQIAELKHEYERLNKKRPLEQDIKARTKGPFQNLLVSLLNGSRDEHRETDLALAHEEAVKLYREGEGKRGVNAAAFNQVLANRNFIQLRITFDHYKQLSHHDIEQAIEHEFSGDNEAGFLALAQCVRNSSSYFAKLLHKSMKGLGTRDSDLIRLVVSRSEIDLAEIKYAYHVLHQKPLEDAIQGDTSGAYRDGLLALVRGNQ